MDALGTAWLAGLIEGEGTIVNSQKTSVALNVFMTDLDVLERCREITGRGSVRGPYFTKGRNHKGIFKWSVTKADDVVFILQAIQPWMGARRGARISEALKRLENVRGRARRLCDEGHNNWHPDYKGGRYCRTCWNERQRERRAAERTNS